MPPNLQKSAYTLRIPVPGTAALPGARRSLHLLPLKVGQRGVGVLRLQVEGDSRWLSSEAHLDIEKGRANSRTAFFWTFLDQAATMIEQASLRQESMQVEVLRRTDALRTALLSSVSHDLRTPLASIKAAASSPLQEDMQWDEDTRRSFANTIEREADRLNRLVENLLDMSRIEGGALKPEKEWYAVSALVQDVVERLQSLWHGREIRAESNLPIIVLSIKDAEHDKVRTLDLGADDYVSKPFGINEVLARIRVALRHATQFHSEVELVVKAGPLTVDFARRKVLVDGRDIKLTPTEYDLLTALVRHSGKIMTRHMLLSQIWGNGYEADAHYLHVYVAHLRQKIEPDPAHPRFILTIPGVGYRFNAEV